jgi:hypothetical protein
VEVCRFHFNDFVHEMNLCTLTAAYKTLFTAQPTSSSSEVDLILADEAPGNLNPISNQYCWQKIKYQSIQVL